MSSLSSTFSPPPLHRRHHHHRRRLHLRPISAALSDPFVLEIAETLEDSIPQSLPLLQPLRDSSSQSLISKPWPSPKQEPFRFTDTSFLRNYQITPAPIPSVSIPSPSSLTILNGHVISSPASSLPAGAFAGSLRHLSPPNDKVLALLNDRFMDGDLFFDLNGVGAADVAVVYVPAGVRVSKEEPLYLRFWYDGGSEVGEGQMPVSNPRVLILVEKGAELAVVEEHVGVNGSEEKCYWANSVVEIVVEEEARVVHTYVQRQSGNAAHTKWTFTRQVGFSFPLLIHE